MALLLVLTTLLRGPVAKRSHERLLQIAPSGAAERCCGFWQDDDQDGERERDRQRCESRGINQSWFIGPLVFFFRSLFDALKPSFFPMPRRQMQWLWSRCRYRMLMPSSRSNVFLDFCRFLFNPHFRDIIGPFESKWFRLRRRQKVVW